MNVSKKLATTLTTLGGIPLVTELGNMPLHVTVCMTVVACVYLLAQGTVDVVKAGKA